MKITQAVFLCGIGAHLEEAAEQVGIGVNGLQEKDTHKDDEK